MRQKIKPLYAQRWSCSLYTWVLAICCATSLDSGNASKLIPAPTFEQVKICDKSCSSPSEISIQLLAMPNKDCAGDTSKGKLSITINATGFVEKNQALLRSGAQVGDPIFVSNTLGDAALAWQQIQSFGFTEVKNTILLSHTKLFG
jgi:hypothetical protein